MMRECEDFEGEKHLKCDLSFVKLKAVFAVSPQHLLPQYYNHFSPLYKDKSMHHFTHTNTQHIQRDSSKENKST